jgi:hypothetical protein
MSQVRPVTYVFGPDTEILERVKGIEPSYSAWKAAALPLSYTRAGVDLTRRAGVLNRPGRPRFSAKTALFPRRPTPFQALNKGRFAAYIDVSINNERR